MKGLTSRGVGARGPGDGFVRGWIALSFPPIGQLASRMLDYTM